MALLNAKQIAKHIGGTLKDDKDTEISGVAKLDEARSVDLCFYANPKYESQLKETKAGIIIVPLGFNKPDFLKATIIEHLNPYYGFCLILKDFFDPNIHETGIEQGSFIHPTAIIGTNVSIGFGAYIGSNAKIGDNSIIYPNTTIGKNVEIGENSIIYANVSVYAACKIGSSCIIHSGTVVGSDGFGFAPVGDTYLKIPQIGNVVIEDDVEIGSNCCIDRATMGSTYIRKGVKLDNLIQIAHNVDIGENTVIASQAGIAGSAKLGKNGMIGGQVGIVGHIQIADYVGVGAQSGVSKSIEIAKSQWMGSPAIPIKDFFKSSAIFKNLPQLNREIGSIKEKIKNKEL